MSRYTPGNSPFLPEDAWKQKALDEGIAAINTTQARQNKERIDLILSNFSKRREGTNAGEES